ncbi:sensor histidine kinase [Paenibacillus sp. FSL K6-0276]|uniref:sensor histidine kinase n=1 Tax=Paenibacillus sp. FSL K6-0276 TaxID=2921450 RepID=UPI0030EF5336
MNKRKYFFNKVFLLVMSGFIIFVICIGGAFYFLERNILMKKVTNSINGTLEQTTNHIEDQLNRMKELARYYGAHNVINRVLEEELTYENHMQINNLLDLTGDFLGGQPTYITIIGNNGYAFTNWETDGRTHNNPDILKYTQYLSSNNAAQLWIPDLPNVDVYSQDKKLVSIISVIIDSTLTNIGQVIIGIPQKYIIDILKGDNGLPGSTTYIVDDKGKVILSSENDTANITMEMDLMDEMSESKTGNFIYDHQGQKLMFFYNQLPSSGWKTVTAIPYGTFMKEINYFLIVIIIAILVAIVFATIISAIISLNISIPIRKLMKSMQILKAGNFETKVDIKGNDEIGILGKHFNDMAHQLNHLVQEKISYEKKQSDLIIANKSAELNMLRAQINPHFLFNTLNSIKCLAIINKSTYVAEMIVALGILLENSMGKGQDFITIQEEINISKKYIELQQMRYGNRLRVHYDIEEVIYTNEIPKLILQPIVENSIIHGISNQKNGGDIFIFGRKHEDCILIEILDNGVGISDEALTQFNMCLDSASRQGLNSIGLQNINDRLQMIYGEEYGVSISRVEEGSGTRVELCIPCVEFRGVERDK